QRIENRGDLLLRQNPLLANQFEDPAAALCRLRRQLGGALVADDRVQRGDGTDTEIDVMAADVGIGGDALDTVHAQRLRRVDEQRLRFEDAGGNHRLEDV